MSFRSNSNQYSPRKGATLNTTTNMKEHTNIWGVTYKVGQTGKWSQKFKKKQRDEVLTIASFTPSKRFMRVTSTKGSAIYLFSTDTLLLKGSHMGNSSINFK